MAKPAKDLLTAWRKERGLSQTELAEQLETTQTRVSEWERGDVVPELRRAVEIEDITDGAVPARAWVE